MESLNKDERMKRVYENKRLPKQMDVINTMRSFCKYPTAINGPQLDGNAVFNFKSKDWLKDRNGKHYIDSYGWERIADNKYRPKIQMLGVFTTEKTYFSVPPTLRLWNGKTYQYVWVLESPVVNAMEDSVKLLEKVICYQTPGCQPLFKAEGIIVPGVAGLVSGKYSELKECGPRYELSKLWEMFGKPFPVKGVALEKYMENDTISVNNLSTTRQFISRSRLSKLLSLNLTVEEMNSERLESYLFWICCSAQDLGMNREEIIMLAKHTCEKKGYPVTSHMIRKAMPDPGKKYTISNKRLNDIFGAKAKEVFPVKEKGLWKKRAKEIQQQIADLANEGLSISQIARQLNVSISLVKRRRSQAVKLGLIKSDVTKAK